MDDSSSWQLMPKGEKGLGVIQSWRWEMEKLGFRGNS
jgi:hypothetical protein